MFRRHKSQVRKRKGASMSSSTWNYGDPFRDDWTKYHGCAEGFSLEVEALKRMMGNKATKSEPTPVQTFGNTEVSMRCARCESGNVFTYVVQRQKSDEPSHAVHKCRACGYTQSKS